MWIGTKDWGNVCQPHLGPILLTDGEHFHGLGTSLDQNENPPLPLPQETLISTWDIKVSLKSGLTSYLLVLDGT